MFLARFLKVLNNFRTYSGYLWIELKIITNGWAKFVRTYYLLIFARFHKVELVRKAAICTFAKYLEE